MLTTGGWTRKERISGGSRTKSYGYRSYFVSSAEGVGKYSTVKGRQPGETIAFHLMSCLDSGSGNICCHLLARYVIEDGTVAKGLRGLVRSRGEEEELIIDM